MILAQSFQLNEFSIKIKWGVTYSYGKENYSQADIRQMAKDENVRFLRLMFTDLFGIIKNVEVPISQLDKLLDNKLMFDGSSIDGFVRIEESDMYLYPDLST